MNSILIAEVEELFLEEAQKEVEELTKCVVMPRSKTVLAIETSKEEKTVSALYYYSGLLKTLELELFFAEKKNFELSSDFFPFFEKKTFRVEAKTEGKKELEMELGEKILDILPSLTVDLRNAQITFFAREVGNKLLVSLDLTQFFLTQRPYKIHHNQNSLSADFANYLLRKMGRQNRRKASFIDPSANLADLILELVLREEKFAKHLHNVSSLPYTKILKKKLLPPEKVKGSQNTYFAIVQHNKHFKELKENIATLPFKIRVSQYEADWLDVKFKKNELDYVLSALPIFKDKDEWEKFIDQFLYQTEFVCKHSITLLSPQALSKKVRQKYRLKTQFEEEIKRGEKKYILYCLEK